MKYVVVLVSTRKYEEAGANRVKKVTRTNANYRCLKLGYY